MINRAKSSLFENGIEDVKKLEDNTDPDLEKRLSLLNNFLFYYAFDRLNEDFGYIEPREYTLELTKTKEGRYILSDESFLELRKEIFVNEYSADGAEAILQRVILRLARIQIQVQPQKIKYKPIKKVRKLTFFICSFFLMLLYRKLGIV